MASASELGYTNPSSTRLREEAALRARSSGFWGGIAEYYDFGLYGTAAAVIFPTVFFGGGENPVLANIASLASFGVAYLARPLGAIVLGNLGDTWGRKKTLYLTLGLMGMATLVIGFLPSYDQIGLAAPIILLFMRLVQGFSAGGEQAGSNTLTSELAPPSKRGRMTAWTMHGLLIGQLLGLAAFIPVSGNEEFLMSWGWRIPYFVAIPLVLFALWKRAKIREPRAVYERIAQLEGRTHEPNLGADCAVHKGKVSVITLFRHHLPNVVRVMMMAQYAITGVLLSNYLLNYATTYWGWERQTLHHDDGAWSADAATLGGVIRQDWTASGVHHFYGVVDCLFPCCILVSPAGKHRIIDDDDGRHGLDGDWWQRGTGPTLYGDFPDRSAHDWLCGFDSAWQYHRRIYPDDCCNVGASGRFRLGACFDLHDHHDGHGRDRLPIDEGDDGRRHRRGVAGGIPA
ncbi:MFS transporter [Trueperella pyogenes]